LVLNLFDKVLKRQLPMQQEGRNEDEKLLHNLLFTQRTGAPNQSDLWILNEDFILFKGVSETKLKTLQLLAKKYSKKPLQKKKNVLSMQIRKNGSLKDLMCFCFRPKKNAFS